MNFSFQETVDKDNFSVEEAMCLKKYCSDVAMELIRELLEVDYGDDELVNELIEKNKIKDKYDAAEKKFDEFRDSLCHIDKRNNIPYDKKIYIYADIVAGDDNGCAKKMWSECKNHDMLDNFINATTPLCKDFRRFIKKKRRDGLFKGTRYFYNGTTSFLQNKKIIHASVDPTKAFDRKYFNVIPVDFDALEKFPVFFPILSIYRQAYEHVPFLGKNMLVQNEGEVVFTCDNFTELITGANMKNPKIISNKKNIEAYRAFEIEPPGDDFLIFRANWEFIVLYSIRRSDESIRRHNKEMYDKYMDKINKLGLVVTDDIITQGENDYRIIKKFYCRHKKSS